MNENSNRAEAERLLGVAEKLLQSQDLNGAREFAVLSRETDPLLDGSEQILAVVDVLTAAENRINDRRDWYAVLQVERLSNDHDLIRKQYQRLALLLHPDKNEFHLADQAFKMVADAWSVLSDSGKKSLHDDELSLFSKVDLSAKGKLPVRRSQRSAGENAKPIFNNDNNSDNNNNNSNNNNNNMMMMSWDDNKEVVVRAETESFWTMCPYCYILYEYPRVYEDCCLRCQNCERAFHAAVLPSLPPRVPGKRKDMYFCHWGSFPLWFVLGDGYGENGGKNNASVIPSTAAPGFPNWMPPMSGSFQQLGGNNGGSITAGVASLPARMGVVGGRGGPVGISNGNAPRKRGRPRKNAVML